MGAEIELVTIDALISHMGGFDPGEALCSSK